MASMFYEPVCAILKAYAPQALGATELMKKIKELYPQVVWSGGQGPVRAMLLCAAAKTSSPIQQVPDVVPPQFFYQEPAVSDSDMDESPIPEASPEEILDEAFQKALNSLKADLNEQVQKINDTAFEEMVNRLISKMGFGRSETTRRTNDHGIDGYIYGDRLGLTVICIQSKHYPKGNNVQRPEIQRFRGALNGRDGVFVTSSDFSSGAQTEAKNGATGSRIVLINGDQLLSYMIEYNVGVQKTERVYELKRIDSDFFEDL